MEQQQKRRTVDRILHKDIMSEILVRLPVKSLLRFRQVCKYWKSLITSYRFRKLHHQIHSSSPPLILTFHHRDSSFKAMYEPVMLSLYCLTIFDLHGKLVTQISLPFSLCQIRSISYQSKLLLFNIVQASFLYNPSTQQSFLLPAPPLLSLPDFEHFTHTYHLGYIPSKDEYMLVCMVYVKSEDEWMCEVLTISISEDNFKLHYSEWRSIKITNMFTYHCVSVFVSGTLYGNASHENGKDCILSFEVETEVISTFAFPEGVEDGTLIELKNEVYLMDHPPTLRLWKLCTDVIGNKSWTLHWNINFQSLGYQQQPFQTEFDWRILIYRVEYLQLYKEPSNVLREMGKLKLDKRLPEEEEEEEEDDYPVMPEWDVYIHTNLLTLCRH